MFDKLSNRRVPKLIVTFEQNFVANHNLSMKGKGLRQTE